MAEKRRRGSGLAGRSTKEMMPIDPEANKLLSRPYRALWEYPKG